MKSGLGVFPLSDMSRSPTSSERRSLTSGTASGSRTGRPNPMSGPSVSAYLHAFPRREADEDYDEGVAELLMSFEDVQ